MESVWYKKIEHLVIEQNEKLHRKDFRFYQVDAFLQMSKKIDELSIKCIDCKHLKPEIEEIAENLHNYLKGDIDSRKNYEKKLDNLNKHLRKEHGIYPKQYNLYTYSFFGLVSGIGAGWLGTYIVDNQYLFEGIITGFVIGLLTGRIIGKIKDRKFKKEGKILE